MTYLVSTGTCNELAQQMALALYECEALGLCLTGFVDQYSFAAGLWCRAQIHHFSPAFDQTLRRRRVELLPSKLLHQRVHWDGLRTLARALRGPARLEDWLFDRFTLDLDRWSADVLRQDRFTAFLGFEYGSLAALNTACRLGKEGVLVYPSPHHRLRHQWVDPAFDDFPDWKSPAAESLLMLSQKRDERRDAEAAQAKTIVSISDLVTASLVQGGIPKEKILTVPLGADPTVVLPKPSSPSGPARFVYVGTLAVHKGIPYLLKAWTLLHRREAELHLYGTAPWPIASLNHLPQGVYWHGPVSHAQVMTVFQNATALVFPSLCDAFGQVVTEALSQGLPVITTPNAGASVWITEGRNGFIIPPRSAERLAGAMTSFLDHPQDIVPMREAALQSAQRRSWVDFRQDLRKGLDIA